MIAIFAPLITKILGISPNTLDRDSLNDYGLPQGRFGGISAEHWLGVEPGTGRDILARLIYGARLSLFVGLVATLITTSVGMVLGLVGGYLRGRVDTFLSRLSDLVMTFPSLILTIALVRPGTQRLEAMGVPEGNPARLTYLMLVTLFFGWVGFFALSEVKPWRCENESSSKPLGPVAPVRFTFYFGKSPRISGAQSLLWLQ